MKSLALRPCTGRLAESRTTTSTTTRRTVVRKVGMDSVFAWAGGVESDWASKKAEEKQTHESNASLRREINISHLP